MPFTLTPVTLPDRASIANIITRANFDDPYGQLVWPNSTIASRTAGTYARLPKTLLSPNTYFLKVVDEHGVAAGYAQWSFPAQMWETLMQGNSLRAVGDAEREGYEREAAASCDSPGWPTGLRRDIVESISPGMEAVYAKVFPEGEERICEIPVPV